MIPRLHCLSLKFVDDHSILVAINLKESLIPDLERVRPVTHDQRTSQILPKSENKMQSLLNQLKNFTDRKSLKIKEIKTKVMKFNSSTSQDFPLGGV